MSRAQVISLDNISNLEYLKSAGPVSACDMDRSRLENLVNRGWATKHLLGRQVTFSLSPSGERILARFGAGLQGNK